MRSELVFTANANTTNRFQLCSSVFTAVRRMHREGSSIPDSINEAMTVCSHDQQPELEKHLVNP